MARTAVLGIGHELRGDDAAGLEVARRLKVRMAGYPDWLVLETGPVPENFSGPLRRFSPDIVILVDAALLDEPPGSLRLVDWREAGGFPSSTHSLPLATLAGFLASELGCEVRLLGIQPGDDSLGAPLSPAVEQGVEKAVELLVGLAEGKSFTYPPTL